MPDVLHPRPITDRTDVPSYTNFSKFFSSSISYAALCAGVSVCTWACTCESKYGQFPAASARQRQRHLLLRDGHLRLHCVSVT